MQEQIIKIKPGYLIRDLKYKMITDNKGKVKRLELLKLGVANPPDDPTTKIYEIVKE